jgi:glycosyltransferase involved in cell wall biosynthesis
VSNRLPLSVAIITLNEEENLPRCLESVAPLAAEIVVIDSGSKDRTGEVARRFGAIFETHAWQGHVAQKNIALQKCNQPWVLCLDADEALYYVNRFNFYLGRWIRHAWYPEWRLRLVQRTAARWGGLDPHDKLEVAGATRRLSGHLLHYPFCSVRDHLESELKYARIMAESYAKSGRVWRWYRAVFSPWLAFFKTLMLKSGWRDGWRGWVIASAKWLNTFAKYAFWLESLRFSSNQQRRL